MSKVTDINEFRAKKFNKTDAEKTARAIMAFEDELNQLEKRYQEQLKQETGELS